MSDSQGGAAPADRLAQAWREHSAAVLAYAARRTSSAEDAADVLAETYLIAWRRIESMPHEPDARPWLFTVARNVLANHYRATSRRTALTESLVAEAARTVAAHHEASGDGLAASELGRALALLPEPDREVLLLAGWDGLTPAQIATVVGCSPPAARVRLHRARRRLRTLLDAAEPPPERAASPGRRWPTPPGSPFEPDEPPPERAASPGSRWPTPPVSLFESAEPSPERAPSPFAARPTRSLEVPR